MTYDIRDIAQKIYDATNNLIKVKTGNLGNLIKFDPDSSQPTYIGLNDDASANDSDTDWLIIKFTYSGSNVTKIQQKIGSWTDRATLF